MPFFNATEFEAKRKFRFAVSFAMPGLGEGATTSLTFMAKTVSKPSFQMESTQHRFLNHEFKFPSIIKWQDINLAFIDAKEPNVNDTLYKVLLQMGYVQPDSYDAGFRGGITKQSASSALGMVRIFQLDGGATEVSTIGTPEGPNIVDEWQLKNAFIQQIKFGDLDYGQDDLVQIDMTLRYDYATFGLSGLPYGLGS